MKRATHRRWWYIAACALIGVVAFRHIWLWMPEHRYMGLISHDDLVSALSAGDSKRVVSLARSYGYDYQVFTNGKLGESSNAWLPKVQLLNQPIPAQGVITTSLKDQLTATKPYEMHVNFHRYVFFATTAQQYTYVLYGKVF